MNLTVFGVEEIASVRKSSRIRKTYRTLGPFHWTHSPAVLKSISYNADSVAHLISNAGASRWNQPPPSLYLFGIHHSIRRRIESEGCKISQECASGVARGLGQLPMSRYIRWLPPAVKAERTAVQSAYSVQSSQCA
jgi:hypothetical protein